MALTSPWKQHSYMGQYADDAAALTFIRACKWDSSGDGNGNPQAGMQYLNTTSKTIKIYDGTAWQSMTLASGTIAFTGKVEGITPTENAQLATKSYVDSVAQGLDPKGSVLVCSTTDITLSGEQVIDGVSVVAGDRVLVLGQADAIENGIYIASATAWARSADMPAGSHAAGTYCFVEEGVYSTNADAGFVCTTNGPDDVVGTDELAFTKFSGAGQIEAGDGLKKDGNTLEVELTSGNSGLELSGITPAKTLQVKVDGSHGIIKGDSGLELELNGTTLSVGASGLSVAGLPSLFTINGTAVGANVTATNLDALTAGTDTSLHTHDGRYYTETELGSTTASSEGAALIGTDTKASLNNATTVEVALTHLNGQNPAKRSSGAGNPNGTVTGAIGDLYVDETNDIVYVNVTGANTGWNVQ